MVNAQTWLDANYPKKRRAETKEIYINEPDLVGELDLSDFTYCEILLENRLIKGVQVFISCHLDKNKLTITNQPQGVEIIKLVNAQE
jgi:hypothetical protein